MYSSYGPIEIDPPGFKPGWMAVRACDDLALYYAALMQRKINLPTRGPHITVTAGHHEPYLVDATKAAPYQNRIVNFIYDNIVWTNGQAFWMDCWSDDLDQIRKELGLGPRKFHLTIGNVK